MKEKPSNNNPRKISTLFAFAQIAAMAGTAVDFAFFFFLNNVVGTWYILANVIGSIMGAITNFMLGRYWVFDSTKRKIKNQAFRYFIVSAGSLLLNTVGIYVVTEYFGVNSNWSKIIVSILVGVTYNFILQKNFVYK